MKTMDSRRRPITEILAVAATGGAFLFFDNVFHHKAYFIIPCILLWGAYVALRLRHDRTLYARWGIRADNLRAASIAPLLFVGVTTLLLVAYRLRRGWQPLPSVAFVVLGLYILWGFIQQFMVQALLVKNLEALGTARWVLVPLAGLLFGLVHAPEWRLAILCALAGACWTLFFLKRPNLIPLALAHAWLGVLVYFWVLERNPWRELADGLPGWIPR